MSENPAVLGFKRILLVSKGIDKVHGLASKAPSERSSARPLPWPRPIPFRFPPNIRMMSRWWIAVPPVTNTAPFDSPLKLWVFRGATAMGPILRPCSPPFCNSSPGGRGCAGQAGMVGRSGRRFSRVLISARGHDSSREAGVEGAEMVGWGGGGPGCQCQPGPTGAKSAA